MAALGTAAVLAYSQNVRAAAERHARLQALNQAGSLSDGLAALFIFRPPDSVVHAVRLYCRNRYVLRAASLPEGAAALCRRVDRAWRRRAGDSCA
ncbi:hypothetical protein D3C73_1328360 [compost metagenome]